MGNFTTECRYGSMSNRETSLKQGALTAVVVLWQNQSLLRGPRFQMSGRIFWRRSGEYTPRGLNINELFNNAFLVCTWCAHYRRHPAVLQFRHPVLIHRIQIEQVFVRKKI